MRGYISPCSMSGSVFVQCRLRPLTFDEVDFSLAVLGGNDLRGVDMGGCRLRETSLVETDLLKAVVCGAPRWRVRASMSRKLWPMRWRTGCVWTRCWER